MEQILTEAAALGVAVTVASGDNGSTDGVNDGKQHVDFPASAPHALGCGGTTLHIANGQIASETVWNELPSHGAGGGGISIEFPVPAYQSATKLPANVDTGKAGRGVPDVSGNADPETGYQVLVDGSTQTFGGTSAVAPLWAGLITLLNESLGQARGLHAAADLHGLGARAGFHDITKGNNARPTRLGPGGTRAPGTARRTAPGCSRRWGASGAGGSGRALREAEAGVRGRARFRVGTAPARASGPRPAGKTQQSQFPWAAGAT